MTFQSKVNRQYTTGFPGELWKDGPTRAKPGRIASASVGADPAASTNRISRAFGFTADVPASGSQSNPNYATRAAIEGSVSVGGPVFYGILGHPKHYALFGSVAGSLSPSMDLPQGSEAEFFDMATGLIVELFNETTAVKAVAFGDQLAYAANTITALENPQVLPYGALISVPAGDAAPDGFVLIPNARIVNPISLAASTAGGGAGLIAGYTVVQLTQ
ncbi:hypothetical protein PLUTO_00200 [Luteibacter phage vB_LflM-Pluto]|uniref:Uncharacterized protein n=1 Tax=Luteibacter phage vB_LflM-Pluto TaxID=2948611 RepID=A0A9E7MT07_9CAUD|nr:hypothetical protein PLUTO_00200 [Luteibacter phage vB_LflM-Pluto]